MKFLKSKKGMTIIEIVVSLGILGLVAVGFTGFFTDSFKFQARNQQIVSIQKIADQTMEKLKINGGITIGPDTLDVSKMLKNSTETLSDDDYNYKITVNSITKVTNGTNFYDITVDVSSKSNKSIKGTVNSTVQIDSSRVDSDANGIPDVEEPVIIKYYLDKFDVEPIKTEAFYKGVGKVTIYTPTKEGYIFTNWLDTYNFSYSPEDEITFDTDILSAKELKLTAQWREQTQKLEYTVTYYANGGTGEMEPQSVYNGDITSLRPNKFTYTGYTFAGWSIVANGDMKYEDKAQIKLTGDLNLYAIWEKAQVPVLAASSSWYKGTTSRNIITQIDIVRSYVPTGNEKETWNADENNTGAIKCYIEGTKLTIAGNGTGSILANEDSSFMFSNDHAQIDFRNVTSINGLTIIDTKNVTNMNQMFRGCQNLASLNLSKFDTSKVTDMGGMFMICTSLTSLDVSEFDTSKVERMSLMFDYCSNLEELDLTNFNTSNVESMWWMFERCTSLEKLNLTSFNTAKVEDMREMFKDCGELEELDLSSFDTAACDMKNMFYGMNTLQQVTLGKSFIFKGNDSHLPTPSSEYISGADGNWYKDSNPLTPSQVAVDTRTGPTTYYAIKPLIGNVVNVGDYVTYVPSSKSYKVPTTVSGYKDDQSYEPSSITQWRVLNINGNEVEIISEDIVGKLYLEGTLGYINVVQTLNDMSTAYVNPLYAKSGRSLGDCDQGLVDGFYRINENFTATEKANYKVIDTASYPIKYYSYDEEEIEEFPYKEIQYALDRNTLDNYGSMYQSNSNVWLASRKAAHLSDNTYYYVNYMNTSGQVSNMLSKLIVIDKLDSIKEKSYVAGVRPVVLLKSDLIVKGSGTIDDPYVINESNPSQYTVTYCANGGYGEMIPQSVVRGSSIILNTNTYKHHTKEFAGWATSATATTATYTDGQTITPTADVTLYAVWSGDAPTLAEGRSWYKGTTAKNTITQIDIKDSYKPITTVKESWNADEKNTGAIKCYIEGTKLTIVGNGTGKIKANKYSAYLFEFSRYNGITHYSNLTQINGLELLDTSDVEDMAYMFFGCNKITELDLSSFNTAKVNNMCAMFAGCESLTNVDVSSFDTSNVTDMSNMFGGSGIKGLYLNNFDTSNVESMYAMFNNCNDLEVLDVSSFDTANVLDMRLMFSQCRNLKSLDISSFDTSNIGETNTLYNQYEMITYMNCMFNALVHLEELTIDSGVRLRGDCALGAPSSEYIPGADDTYWYTLDGNKYILYEVIHRVVSELTTYYAIKPAGLTLTYDANGGSGAPTPQTITTTETTATFTISTVEPTPPAGKAFRGWSLDSSDTTADYKVGSKIEISSNTTLYAVYVTPLAVGSYLAGSDVGAYVTYTPSETSYKVSKDLSGYASDQTYNPSKYTTWRVFSNNGTEVEIISDESVDELILSGATGYKNAVQILKDMSEAYVNSEYAKHARSLGYSEAGLYDGNGLENIEKYKTIVGELSESTKVEFPYIDTQYTEDELVIQNNGSLKQIGSELAAVNTEKVWLASRHMSNSVEFDKGEKHILNDFGVMYIDDKGDADRVLLYHMLSAVLGWKKGLYSAGVRPIVNLIQTVQVASGDGSPSNPYILSKCVHDYKSTEVYGICQITTTYTCSKCYDSYTENKNVHLFDMENGWYSYDENDCLNMCYCKQEIMHHSHKDLVVTRTNATCTSWGSVDYQCSKCGGGGYEILPTPHAWDSGVCVICGTECTHEGGIEHDGCLICGGLVI